MHRCNVEYTLCFEGVDIMKEFIKKHSGETFFTILVLWCLVFGILVQDPSMMVIYLIALFVLYLPLFPILNKCSKVVPLKILVIANSIVAVSGVICTLLLLIIDSFKLQFASAFLICVSALLLSFIIPNCILYNRFKKQSPHRSKKECFDTLMFAMSACASGAVSIGFWLVIFFFTMYAHY